MVKKMSEGESKNDSCLQEYPSCEMMFIGSRAGDTNRCWECNFRKRYEIEGIDRFFHNLYRESVIKIEKK